MESGKRRWVTVAKVCVAIALVSLVFNISLPWEMAGGLQPYSFVRKTITKVLNAGSVWAGVSVYAGWRLARPLVSTLGGVVAAEATLLVHYVLGLALGIYDATILTSNTYWFVAGVVLCAPLGWCGWLASRPGWAGLAARLVVPVGALCEPFVLRRFTHPYLEIPWPERYSDTASGVLLLLLGGLAAAFVLRRGPRGFVNAAPARVPDA